MVQGFAVDFIDDKTKVTCWISMQTIMTASVALGDLYRLVFVPNIYVLLWSHGIYNQPLPIIAQPAKCYMMKGIQTDTSNYSRILTDQVSKTNVRIIDSECSDHMFNISVQLTDYYVLNDRNKSVRVANGQMVPVFGMGTCGIL